MSKIIINTMAHRECTVGILEVNGFTCFTLELPWLFNAQKVSCIPAGKYHYRKHVSPSLGDVVHLYDVEGRTWVYIHAGNYTSQIQGCILVGDMIKDINGDGVPDVGNSSKTFKRLMDLLDDEGTVTIHDESRI